MFQAVIFDWDGTLADTREVIVRSFQDALTSVGVAATDEFIERRIGIGAEKTFREILQQSKIPPSEAVIKRLIERKIQTEIELAGNVKLFKGVKELLEVLQGKVKIGLASMNNRKVIECLLAEFGIQEFFDEVIAVEDVTKSKPDPEIFLKCASGLKASPEECVVVEDSIFGVQAAKAGGMSCIAVLTGVYNRAELEKANPDLIVESLAKKNAILDYILG